MITPLKDQIRAALVEALAATGQNQREARLLNITPRKMNHMMVRHGIPRPMDKQRETDHVIQK